MQAQALSGRVLDAAHYVRVDCDIAAEDEKVGGGEGISGLY